MQRFRTNYIGILGNQNNVLTAITQHRITTDKP